MMNTKSVMPTPSLRVVETQISISELIGLRDDYKPSDYPWAVRFLGKFPIPSWQRKSVWTQEQKVAVIKSAYEGFDIGSVMINDWHEVGGKLADFSDALIDGQQRVEAFIEYVNDKFTVCGYYWSQLNRNDQRRFLYRQIGCQKIFCFDETKLKKLYNIHNFSGTRHLLTERA